MSTLYETQLNWIQRNRRRKPRARSIGSLLERLADGLGDKAWAAVRDVATALADCVDEDFREHCRLTMGRAGQLRVNVDHAGLVYLMRTQWLAVLTRVLIADNRNRSVQRITFGYGLGGVAVGKLTTGQAEG